MLRAQLCGHPVGAGFLGSGQWRGGGSGIPGGGSFEDKGLEMAVGLETEGQPLRGGGVGEEVRSPPPSIPNPCAGWEGSPGQ